MAAPVVVSRIQNRRGTQAQFDSLYPPGYNGIGGVSIIIWPNILLPGELALATDTGRIFLGNLNGEYIELGVAIDTSIVLAPLVLTLPPVGIMTVIPALTYQATPFFDILYSITDSLNPDWNTPGTNFSRNGLMQVTSIAAQATLSDTSTEVNLDIPDDISFSAQYSAGNIEILYMHDFAGSLTFSTSSISWLPF
jgi:hypothetical protein